MEIIRDPIFLLVVLFDGVALACSPLMAIGLRVRMVACTVCQATLGRYGKDHQ